MATLRLGARLFGVPAFAWQGQAFTVPTRKAAALLGYLALTESAPRAELAEVLWGPGKTSNLRTELHRLRGLPGAEVWLEAGTEVSLLVASDVGAFEEAISQGEVGRALELYDGEDETLLLRGLEPKDAPAFVDWLGVERARIEALLHDALRAHTEALEQASRWAEALEWARRLLERDALDESAHRAVMRLEWQRGNLRAAQGQFERCRRVLAEELGVAPLPETLQLAQAIERAQVYPEGKAVLRRIPPQLLRPPVLVGREREWATLERAWQKGQAIYLSGAPGVGKTRLLMDFVEAKTAGNFSLVQGRVGDGSVPLSTLARAWRHYYREHPGAAYRLEPWVQREVARFLPDYFDFAVTPIRSEGERLRFREAVFDLFAEKNTTVDASVADDLQFFDGMSFFLSAYATGRLVREGLAGKRIKVLTAFRRDEMPAPFFHLIGTQVANGRAVHIDLEPFSTEAVRTLLHSLELPADDASSTDMKRLTGGNPLYIVEVLRDGFEKGSALPERGSLPERVNLHIGDRLSRLPKNVLYLAQTLAALQDFGTLETLESILDLKAFELAEGLAELERAQIITGSAFSHDLVYEAVLRHTPLSVAQLIHHKIAATLQAEAGEPARIAYHWDRSAQPQRALLWFVAAAEIALTQGSFDKARDWLEQVLGEAPPDSEPYRQASALLAAARLDA